MEGTASKRTPVEKKTNKKSFFNGVKSEYNKIVWPDRETVGKEAVAVLVCSVALGLIIAVMDLVISFGLSFIL